LIAAAMLVLAGTLVSAAAQAQPATGTLARIAAARQINVAVSGDSPPFSYVEKNQQPVGYSIDLCRQVIGHLSRVVGGPELKVNWLVGSAAERVQMVAERPRRSRLREHDRDADADEERRFLGLIFVEVGGFLAAAGSAIQGISDMNGKRIGVIRGTTTETRLNQLLKERGFAAKVTLLNDGTEGVAMIESGSLDIFASDKIKLVTLSGQRKDPSKLALLADDLSYEPLAFAVPRGDSNFRLEVNRGLTRTYVSGDIDPIFRRWFAAFGRPNALLSAVFVLNAVPE
jgi:ABC-type amino acid transport substrate-binding protein